MQRRLKRRKQKTVERAWISRVEKGFSKLENCFEQMKVFSTQFDCSMKILRSLAEDLEGEEETLIFSQEISTSSVVYDKSLFCGKCRNGEHFEKSTEIEEEYEHDHSCHGPPITMSSLPGPPENGAKLANVTSGDLKSKMANCFQFDSDVNKESYSPSNSRENNAQETRTGQRKRRVPSGLSDISKTEDGELISESEFNRMMANKNRDQRITFGFEGTPETKKHAPGKKPKTTPAKNEQNGFERQLEKIKEVKNDNSNENHHLRESLRVTKTRVEEHTQQTRRGRREEGRRGTVDTEDLYKSNSVDLSFDGRNKQAKTGSVRTNNFSLMVNGTESDFDTPFRISGKMKGTGKVREFAITDRNVFANLAQTPQNSQRSLTQLKKVDFLERNKKDVQKQSERVRSQRNKEHRSALERIRQRTQSAHSLIGIGKRKSSLNMMIGSQNSLPSVEERLANAAKSNELVRRRMMIEGVSSEGHRPKNKEMKVTEREKADMDGEKFLLESNLVNSPENDGPTRKIGGMVKKKPLSSSLNMKMTIPKGKGLAGGNMGQEEGAKANIIGEKGEAQERELENMKKSKSGMLGKWRERDKMGTVKLYKRNSLSRSSQRGLNMGGILSGEEDPMMKYRSKSQEIRPKRSGVVGMNEAKGGGMKNRIYQRDALGNFEKQLYESENLGESQESPNQSQKEKRANKKARNFQKKREGFQEAIGEGLVERVIVQNNKMAERTVQKVLEHGEKNTKLLKEAFREFLSGFRKVEDSDEEMSPGPETRSLRKLRKDLEQEKRHRKNLEKSVKELRDAKTHASGGYSTVGGEEWERKCKIAQRELVQANERALILQNNTTQMEIELERLKRLIRKQRESDESRTGDAENGQVDGDGRGLPKYVYIRTVKSRYDHDTDDQRSSNSVRGDRSTRKVKSRFFLDEFSKNPRMVDLERERETTEAYENKLYRLRGMNTYEVMGNDKRTRTSGQRRSKSLFGESRFVDWRKEPRMGETDPFLRGRQFVQASGTMRSEASREKKDAELNRALENQLGLANKLIERLEKEAHEYRQSMDNMHHQMQQKDQEIEHLRELLEKAQMGREMTIDATGQREREGSIGSMRSRDSVIEGQHRFSTFNQKGKMRIYESENKGEGDMAQETVVITEKRRMAETVHMDADLLKFLYSQSLFIDETIRLNLMQQSQMETELPESAEMGGRSETPEEEDIDLGLEPINELTEDMGASDKIEEEVWGKEFSQELFRDVKPSKPSGFNMFKSDGQPAKKPSIRKSLKIQKKSFEHHTTGATTPILSGQLTPEKTPEKLKKTSKRKSQFEKAQEGFKRRTEGKLKNDSKKQKLLEETETENAGGFEEVHQAEMEEYFSEGDGRYFISGNLILKVDQSGRIVNQKIISPKSPEKILDVMIEPDYPVHRPLTPEEMCTFTRENRFQRRTIKESINSNNYSDGEEEGPQDDLTGDYEHPNGLYNQSEQESGGSELSNADKRGESEQGTRNPQKGRIFLTGENATSGVGLDHGSVRPFHTIRSSFNPDDFDT